MHVCVEPEYQVRYFRVDEARREIIYHRDAPCFPCPNHYDDYQEEHDFTLFLEIGWND